MKEPLLPGEVLVAEVHRHSMMWMVPALLPAALTAAILAGLLLVPAGPVGQTRLALAAAVLLAGVAWIQILHVRWRSAAFILTDRRVILVRGVFSRFTRSVRIDRIQNVSSQQSLLGRMLGYGTVILESAGSDGVEALANISRPGEFRDLVFAEIDRVASPV